MCTIWKNTTRSKLLKPVSAILEKTLLLPFVIPNGLWLPTPDVYRSGNVFSRFLFHASVSLMVQEVAEQQHLVLCHFPSRLTFLFKNPSCKEFRRTDEYNWLNEWEVRTMVVKALSVAWKEFLPNPRMMTRAFEKPGLSLPVDGGQDPQNNALPGRMHTSVPDGMILGWGPDLLFLFSQAFLKNIFHSS